MHILELKSNNDPAADQGAIFYLQKINTLGSGAANSIRLKAAGVADEHAVIVFNGREFEFRSMDKKNIVKVNGKSKNSHILVHQDILEIGDLRLVFNLLSETVISTPAENVGAEILDGMVELTGMLADETDLEKIFDILLRQLVRLMRAERGFIILQKAGEWSVAGVHNVAPESLLVGRNDFSETILQRVLETRQPLLVSDAMSQTQFKSAESVLNFKVRSILSAPLIISGEVLGVIYLGNNKLANLFGPEELRILSAYSGEASLLIKNSLLMQEIGRENSDLRMRLAGLRKRSVIAGCPGMLKIMETVEKIADTRLPVILLGPTGSGKEVIAHEIHNRSSRRDKTFVAVNCAAIPENLLEAELFGVAKGAYTGAAQDRRGKFETADGGTLFLDEICDMAVGLQAKLLRTLQEGVVEPVGSNKLIRVDVRLISASNKDMTAMVGGSFRKDLYYRLNGIIIYLPPLKDRGEDILALARMLLEQTALESGSRLRFSRQAEQDILRYEWPGNVREMENRIRRAAVLAKGLLITSQDLELGSGAAQKIMTLEEAKEALLGNYIDEIIALNNGNREQTARDLNVAPRTIYRHLEKKRV